jgi:hypothetical protein
MDDAPAITEQFVGRPAPGVETVMVEGEALLLDEHRRLSHALNSTAALVWQCFDGDATLGEITLDIADALGLDQHQVAVDTSAIAAQLVELGVVVMADAEPAPAPVHSEEASIQSYREYLDHQFTLGADGVIGLRTGDRTVVMRSNDRHMLGLFRDALGPRVVREPDGPPDLSLLFGPTKGSVRGAHFLYGGDRLVLHTKSEGRLLRAAIRCAERTEPVDGSVVPLRARQLRNAHSAILVASTSGTLADLNGRRAARQGWALVDGDVAYLDPDRSEVLVFPSTVDAGDESLGEINRRFPPEPGESLGGPVRAPVVGLVVLGGDIPTSRSDTPAQRAAKLLPFADGASSPDARGDAISAVTKLSERVPVRILPEWQEHALSAILSPSGLRRPRA